MTEDELYREYGRLQVQREELEFGLQQIDAQKRDVKLKLIIEINRNKQKKPD